MTEYFNNVNFFIKISSGTFYVMLQVCFDVSVSAVRARACSVAECGLVWAGGRPAAAAGVERYITKIARHLHRNRDLSLTGVVRSLCHT